MLLVADVVGKLGDALSFAFGMFWEILWTLTLGSGLSAVVQAVVSKREMQRLLPDDSPRSIAVATGLGVASSSCSYAAVALARSLFRKGANFTAAMAFQFASTNLVVELGIIIALILGWQFTAGDFVGGPLMIVLLVLLFRRFLRQPNGVGADGLNPIAAIAARKAGVTSVWSPPAAERPRLFRGCCRGSGAWVVHAR